MYLTHSFVRTGGAQRILFKAQDSKEFKTLKKKLNGFNLVCLLNQSILGKEKKELGLGTEGGEVREVPGSCVEGRGHL